MSATDATIFNLAVPEEGVTAQARRITFPWHWPALGAILLLAAFLNFYQLAREGYANSYYAAAVKSMSLNWHNFFFASFDPGGFVTIDKPPLGFWFQVASVKLFGYSGVSLLLPEGLAGILSVALLYHLVQRVFGRAAGLLSALILAITPVAVADNRNNTIDSILVLFMLLGAWAASRAVESRRAGLRWLLACAVLVGLGFNIKMLEAYLVVPAFGLVYLLGARVRWRARLAHLALASLVLLTVSLSWAVAVDLTPASQRPWVDSTTTNSEIDLAIGYNGLQRLLGQGGPGGGHQGQPGIGGQRFALSGTRLATSGTAQGNGVAGSAQPTLPSANGGPRGGGGGGLFNNGSVGPFRLLDQELGGQVGWLLPLAVIALLAACLRRVRFPLERHHKGLILWGAWLLTTVGFFSVAGFFHSYYLVTVAPAAAALAGIGLVALWRDYLHHPRLGDLRGWLLPIALLATALSQVHLLSAYPDWSRWITPLILGLTLAAILWLVAARLRPRRAIRLWTPVAAALGAVALLLAPTVWAADTMSNANNTIPAAGPTAQKENGFGHSRGDFGGGVGSFGAPLGGQSTGQPASGSGTGQLPGGPPSGQPPMGAGFGSPGAGGGGAGADTRLLAYLEQHQGTTTYLFATANSNSAAPYIIQSGKPVMSLGGFSGNDPILTLAAFQALVKNNTVRYVLAGGGPGGQDDGDSVMAWVQTACTAVPTSAWQGTTGTAAGGPMGGGMGDFGGASQLYLCGAS